MEPADGFHHRVDGGVLQDVVKIVGDGGVGQAQLPAAQNPDHRHVLPGGDDLVNTLAYGAEAQ